MRVDLQPLLQAIAIANSFNCLGNPKRAISSQGTIVVQGSSTRAKARTHKHVETGSIFYKDGDIVKSVGIK